jgi:hypothetical protein
MKQVGSVYRSFSLPPSERQVLGADLNCSESRSDVRFGSSSTQPGDATYPCTSASPRKRTNSRRLRYVRLVPKAAASRCSKKVHSGRTSRLIKSKACPTQNLVDIIGGTPPQVRDVWSVGHQAARFDVFPETVYRWQPRGSRQPSGKAGAAL